MHYDYNTCGTCSRAIHFDITDGRISGISFDGGCHGNLQGIAALAEGQDAAKVAATVAGIRCGNKPTSCPDQLARAIAEAVAGQQRP